MRLVETRDRVLKVLTVTRCRHLSHAHHHLHAKECLKRKLGTSLLKRKLTSDTILLEDHTHAINTLLPGILIVVGNSFVKYSVLVQRNATVCDLPEEGN